MLKRMLGTTLVESSFTMILVIFVGLFVIHAMKNESAWHKHKRELASPAPEYLAIANRATPPQTFAARGITGEQCFKGECGGCDDCSKKLSTRACYSCCITNCITESSACQEHCDGNNPVTRRLVDDAEGSGELLVELGGWIEEGREWGYWTAQAVEYLSAASEAPAIRRLALATLADAWAHGLLDNKGDEVFMESIELALISDDYFARDTALIVVVEHRVPVSIEALIPELVRLSVSNRALAIEIEDAFTQADIPDWPEGVARHQQRLDDAIDGILRFGSP